MTDLISSYYTTAGVSPAAGGSSPLPFEARVRACAEAGYAGIGIHVRDYRALTHSGMTDADLRAVLETHGMRHIEIEFLLNWFADGELGSAARRDEDLLYHMAEAFGARVMFLGGDMRPGSHMPFDELAERFAALCARAATRGVTVGVEPCAWTNIGTVDDAVRLVEAAGAKNAGAFLDVWHLYRRGFDYERLREVGAGRIVGVQLGDAAPEVRGALPDDSLDHRLLPGDGGANVATFVRVLDTIGYTGPLSVEVISDTQRARAPEQAARASYLAAQSVTEKARGAQACVRANPKEGQGRIS
jgi:sugar phosphate isomerase/epimerase